MKLFCLISGHRYFLLYIALIYDSVDTLLREIDIMNVLWSLGKLSASQTKPLFKIIIREEQKLFCNPIRWKCCTTIACKLLGWIFLAMTQLKSANKYPRFCAWEIYLSNSHLFLIFLGRYKIKQITLSFMSVLSFKSVIYFRDITLKKFRCLGPRYSDLGQIFE